MPLDLAWLSNMGLPEIMLWLLSFAIVYGVIDKVKFIANREVNAIIAIVTAFLVLFATPIELIMVLSSMSQSLVLVVLGILVLFVFAEVAGLRHKEVVFGPDGKPLKEVDVPLFSANKTVTGIAFLIITILIFVGAGGLGILGWNVDLTGGLSTSMLFFVVVIIAILWMITEKKEETHQRVRV
ncbi:MAG: hypothetical protein GOV02_02655 [Candidatus Aenigmarchaeota archaeon]|nr:hypothetical protein [Candidatus Aenigmarchaeota archaeon]